MTLPVKRAGALPRANGEESAGPFPSSTCGGRGRSPALSTMRGTTDLGQGAVSVVIRLIRHGYENPRKVPTFEECMATGQIAQAAGHDVGAPAAGVRRHEL